MRLPQFAPNLHNLGNGLEMADHLIDNLLGKVDEKINIMETLKKVPDYHANYCVERVCGIASMKMALKDEKADDCYLESDEEPVSTKFNYRLLAKFLKM